MSERFARKWGWIEWVRQISDITKLDWDKIFEKNIYEFFNLICFILEKNEAEKENIEKWKRKH